MLVSQVPLPEPSGCVLKNRMAFLSWLDDVVKVIAKEVSGFCGDMACDFQDDNLYVNVITYPDERIAIILDDDTRRLLEDLGEHFIKNQEPALTGGVPGGADGTLDCISPD